MGWWVVPFSDQGASVDSGLDATVGHGLSPLDPVSARAYVREAFEAFQRDVFSFSMHATRDPDIAADVTQDAFLRLLTETERRGPPEHPKGWLLRVAANLVISRGRRVSVAQRWVQRFGQRTELSESPEVGILQQEHRERVRELLQVVPPDARICLLMAAEGFSGREIADAIGRTELATRVLMSRARNRLREALAGEAADDDARPTTRRAPGL